MFDQIQKILAEETARIATKGYKTAEVSVIIGPSRVTWLYRAAVRELDYGNTKHANTLDELHDKISDLPDATDSAKADVIERHAAVLARAAELGVSL